MQVRGGRASPAQLQQLPRESLRGREMGLAVGRFVASSVKDLAPCSELRAEIPENTTGGGIWKIHSSTWIWASLGTRHCLLWIVLACRLCQNPAKELPGSNSSTFPPVPRSGMARSSPTPPLPAEPVECPAVEQPLELHRCHPQDVDAQCVCPGVLASV